MPTNWTALALLAWPGPSPTPVATTAGSGTSRLLKRRGSCPTVGPEYTPVHEYVYKAAPHPVDVIHHNRPQDRRTATRFMTRFYEQLTQKLAGRLISHSQTKACPTYRPVHVQESQTTAVMASTGNCAFPLNVIGYPRWQDPSPHCEGEAMTPPHESLTDSPLPFQEVARLPLPGDNVAIATRMLAAARKLNSTALF